MIKGQLQYGSQGNDVKELQTMLNNKGYELTVDGVFGSNTQNAVKDYQQKNNLAVDGIVGTNTLGTLTGSSSSTSNSSTVPTFEYDDFKYNGAKPAEKEFSYDSFKYDGYKESDIVNEAKAALDAQLANKPGAYQSQWQTQLNDTINKILNREKFSYDLNGDALYQQYKDKYTQQAKMARADSIGQASAMTGGYGNSYAQSVGQQMYAKEMQNLNDIVPELYQMAYDKYNQEGQDLYNQYSMLGAQEEQDYGRYRDSVSDWNAERDYLANRYDSERDYDYSKYNNERNFAYGQYSDDRNFSYGQYVDDRNYEYNKYIDDLNYQYGKYSDDKNLAYNEYRNAIADEQWKAEFDEAQRQFDAQMTQKAASSSGSTGSTGGTSGSGSGSGGSGGNGNNNTGNGGSGNTNTSEVPDSIKQKAATFTNNDALDDYLTKQYQSGKITEEQMGELYIENEISSLSKRNWTLVDDGGVNWLWGVDNNAVVKDQYGNSYRLDKLVDALVAEGMSKSEAKSYVKNLQGRLGA